MAGDHLLTLPTSTLAHDAHQASYGPPTQGREQLVPRVLDTTVGGKAPDGLASPVAKLLDVLSALLNGLEVDMEDVKWLWTRATTRDSLTGACPSQQPCLMLQGKEENFGATLAALLGSPQTRRGSGNSDLSSLSAMCTRSSRHSTRSSLELAHSDDSAEDEPLAQGGSSPRPAREVEDALLTADCWGFDAFRLADATDGRPLAVLGFWLLTSRNLVRDLDLDAQRLLNFLSTVERQYARATKVPYHNNVHAADVLQQMHMLLTAGRLGKEMSKVEPLAELACYLAAIIHDVDHQGLTNDYLARTDHRLALLYNDTSPLENHHLATAFLLLQQDELNFLCNVPRDCKARLRRLVVSMVLATDMKMHMSLVAALRSKLDVQPNAERQAGQEGEALKSGGSDLAQTVAAAVLLDSDTDAGRMLLLQIALKCADMGHVAAPWHIHRRWVGRLEEELFLQGDQEAAAQLPVSPLMSRSGDGVSRSQAEFLAGVALPMLRVWADALPGAAPMVAAAEANLGRWRALQARGPQSGDRSRPGN